MTRLIDAKRLERVALMKFYITNYVWHICRMIDEQPTVDAIPVDFIEKEAEKMRMSENPAIRINSVILTVLIKKWREKQNETCSR